MHQLRAHLKNTLKPDQSSQAKLTLEVLLVDRDVLFLTLIGNILKTFGIEKIHYASSGEIARDVLNQQQIDLVMSEWPMAVEGEAESIADYMRSKDGAKFQKIPLIVITSHDIAKIVQNSRDRGINEFLLKPIRVPKLCQRIRSVIEDPREFIVTKDYQGPDRRRKVIPVSEKYDRRMPPAEIKKRSRREKMATVIVLEDQEVVREDKDYNLVRKIGQAVSLDDIFSPALIEEAQEMLTSKENEYMEAASEDMIWLTNAIKQLTFDPNNIQVLEPMIKRAQAIREKAGVFGFNMAATTAASLINYLKTVKTLNDNKLAVIREHIDVLLVVFHQRLYGTGGDQGHQLAHYIDKMKSRFPSDSSE